MRTNNRLYASILFFSFGLSNLYADIQPNNLSIDEYIADIFEQYTAETEQDLDAGLFYEELMTLYSRPINLNNTTREALEKMMFLSDSKIENILYYLYKFGSLQTIYELQLIEGLDMTDIRYMLPFVVIGDANEKKDPINLSRVIKYGKNELLASFSRGIENKSGYTHIENDSSKYSGSYLYHHFKYRFHYKDRVFMSITAEKDAGEEFFKGKRSGYDFYSASLQLKDLGFVKNIVIGDYQAGFGQGLVIKKSFLNGKTSMATNVLSNSNGFKRYSSTNEFNFFRGTGISLQHKNINMHLFYSNKSIDGNIQGETFSGFYESGYHRTENEIKKKNTVQQILYGGNITLTKQSFQIGVTSVFMQLSHDLISSQYPYNLFYFQGNRQLVTGLNYRIKWKKFNFFGETAMTDKAFATIHGCTYSPMSRVNIVLVHRDYAPEFNAVFASAFSEGSSSSNERGVYIGVEMTPFKYWKLVAYADSYQFPWLKYGIDTPSGGKDFLLQLNYFPSRQIDMFWRLKHEQNVKNQAASITTVPEPEKYVKSSLRYQLVYYSGQFSFKNVLEGNIVKKADESITYGLLAMQEVSYSNKSIPLVVNVRYLFFDVENYNNRIYAHEKDVLYAFSYPMFSGLGSRYYINFRYDLSRSLSCWMKFSQTIFADDRETIGSGNELISGNKKTEIKCLIRWRFNNY